MNAMTGVRRSVRSDEKIARLTYAVVHTYPLGFAALEASRTGWVPADGAPDGLVRGRRGTGRTATSMSAAITTSPQLFYAFTLGMLAAVNPCGFPLLPAYLELFTGGPKQGGAPGRAGRAVTAGAFSTLGFLLLFGSVGAVVEVGWAAGADHALNTARFVMVGVGVSMAAIAVASLLDRPLRLHLPELRPGLGLRRPVALLVFGLSYGIASLGCALPLFISGVATTFTHSDLLAGLGVFVAYSLGMGTVLAALALGVALLGPAAARPLRRISRLIPVLGSVLLLVVGLYLTWYWLAAIIAPTASSPVERLVASAQAELASILGAHPAMIGGLLGGSVVAAILIAGLSDRHRPDEVARSRAGEPVPTTTTLSQSVRSQP